MDSRDPFDQLRVPPPGDDGYGGESERPPKGYGHIPQADQQREALHAPVIRTQARRDVFWGNVVREILMALASAAAESSGRLNTGPAAASSSAGPVDDLFDGRMGVITSLGQRIPIADLTPVFACTVDGCKEDRTRSGDVQCTVYRISTPTGESYTLPISQIIGVHSLSEKLVEELERKAGGQNEVNQAEHIPFGFAAYTSLARSEDEAEAADAAKKSPPTNPP